MPAKFLTSYRASRYPALSGLVDARLSAPSEMFRNRAMANMTNCLTPANLPHPHVRVYLGNIAEVMLARFEPLLTSNPRPEILKFATELLCYHPIARVIAQNGGCVTLAYWAIFSQSEVLVQFAIKGLRYMVAQGGETKVSAIRSFYPYLGALRGPGPDNTQRLSPAFVFFLEVIHQVIADCIQHQYWTTLSELMKHPLPEIRRATLPRVVTAAQESNTIRNALVPISVSFEFTSLISGAPPSPEVVQFFLLVLPLVAHTLCRVKDNIRWLLSRFGDKTSALAQAAADTFRLAVTTNDAEVLTLLVQVNILHELRHQPSATSEITTSLLADLLPKLAVAYATQNQCQEILNFLQSPPLGEACLTACELIIASHPACVNALFQTFTRWPFGTLNAQRLCSMCVPAFCQGWITSMEVKPIAQFVSHDEMAIRKATAPIWIDLMRCSNPARTAVLTAGLLESTIFEWCASADDGVYAVGCESLILLAAEIGSSLTACQAVTQTLLGKRLEASAAALWVAYDLSRGTIEQRTLLVQAGTFVTLQKLVHSPPNDQTDMICQAIANLSDVSGVENDADACGSLLKLLW